MLKSKLHNTLLFVFLSLSIAAQVGVNTTDPKSILDIEVSDPTDPSPVDGILIPRVDDFTTVDPGADQDGMLVFLNNDVGSDPKGFYYWDNDIPDWVGIGGNSNGEWQDGTNTGGDNLIFAIQAEAAGQDVVIVDDTANGATFGLGTDSPVERFEMRGDGDNDMQLTSASTNPPNYIVENAGGTVDAPTPIDPSANRGEIGSLVAKTYANNNPISIEVGGSRFFVDRNVSGGVVPMRYGITLRDLANNDRFSQDQLERLSILGNGNIGLSNPDPTASLHLPRGTTAAGTAPIKFGGFNADVFPGTDPSNQPPVEALMSTPEAGALEFDGDHLYITDNANVRHEIATVGGGGATLPATVVQNVGVNVGTGNNNTQTITINVPGLDANTMSVICTPKSFVQQGLIISCFQNGGSNVVVTFTNTRSFNIGYFGNIAITAIAHN